MTDEKDTSPTPEEERAAAVARGDIVDEGELEEAAAEAEEVEEVEEEELDASAEEDEEDEDQPGDSAPGDEITIPKARYDEDRRNSRAREAKLQARIEELEGKQKKDDTPSISDMQKEIEDLEDQHENLLLEGEIDKAKIMRRDINAKRNDLIDRRIAEKSTAMGQAAVEQVRYDSQLAALEARYPVMNPDSPEFDGEVMTEIITLMDAFEASGKTLTQALNKAVHYVMRDVEPEKKPAVKKGEAVREERKTAARKKALKAVKDSPADLKDIGRNSDKAGRDDGLPDPLKMSQEDFDKLSEKQLKQLREDQVIAH
jgi:gamma-glutamylcyclotransferase (GGCT)/AIG2-like uncharacterized protein YtfP